MEYLLKSTACLTILLLFYKIFLERENMHVFKRFFLIAALLVSLTFPQIIFTTYVETQSVISVPIEPVAFTSNFVETTMPSEEPFDPKPLLWIIYFIGVLFFTFRFFHGLFKISKRIRLGLKLPENLSIKVLHNESLVPHTFFKFIFLNRKQYEAKQIPNEVLLHEEAHVRQKHSIDIILIELLQIIFWFNPLWCWAKHLIKTNHEFLADQSVTHQTKNITHYQHLLLYFADNAKQQSLAHSINYSSIEKRLLAMKKITSKSKQILLSLCVLPLFALLIYSFSTTETVERVETSGALLQKVVEQQETKKEGISEAMIQEYRDLVKATKNSKDGIIIRMGDYERASAIYGLMSDVQRASVEKYPEPPMVNLGKTQKKSPTAVEFESWKDETKFAIWINSKHVPNSALDKYSIDDIVHYSGSFVHNNARSEKFPQEYQFHLFTEKGFEHTYEKANVNEYSRLAKIYTDQIEVYLKNKSEASYAELRIAYTLAHKAYNKLTQDEIKKYGVKEIPPLPTSNKSANLKKQRDIKKVKGSTTPQIIYTARNIEIEILDEDTYRVNQTKIDKNQLLSTVNQLHQDITPEIRNNILNIHVSSPNEVSNADVWFIYNSLWDYGFYRIVAPNQEVNRYKGNTPMIDEVAHTIQKKLKANITPNPQVKSSVGSKINFLIHAEKLGAMFTHIDASYQHSLYHSNISLNEAIELVKNDTKMQLYPKNDRYGTFVLLSNNIENNIPKLTSNNKVKHFRALNVIGARYYLNNIEVTLKEAIRFVRKNQNVMVTSTINPPVVKIEK